MTKISIYLDHKNVQPCENVCDGKVAYGRPLILFKNDLFAQVIRENEGLTSTGGEGNE